jgi:hypothetical protein
MFGFEKEELECSFFPFRCVIGENVKTQQPRRINKKKTFYHILIWRIRIAERMHDHEGRSAQNVAKLW